MLYNIIFVSKKVMEVEGRREGWSWTVNHTDPKSLKIFFGKTLVTKNFFSNHDWLVQRIIRIIINSKIMKSFKYHKITYLR